MTKLRRNLIVALALVLGLSGGAALALLTTDQSALSIPAGPDGVAPTSKSPSPTPTPGRSASLLPPSAPPTTSPSGASSSTSNPANDTTSAPPPPSPPIRPTIRRPPGNSVHIPDRYVLANQAKRSTWDDVLDAGSAIPGVSSRCAKAWRSSGKDRKVDWGTATYRCLDRLPGATFKPQGVAGSGTAEGYTIGHLVASERNIIITSWYSNGVEKDLIAPNRTGESVTRLVVMDIDRGRYNTVELVKTDGARRFRNLNSHGSGLVWAGQYIYSSSRSALWMYNADDILRIRGKFVLPAVSGWSVDGSGGLSSISIDRSTTPSQLTAINYSKDERAYIQNFDLESDGRLAGNSDQSRRGLSLRNTFGQGGRIVRSADSDVVEGSSFQGVATIGDFSLANSSALRFDGGGPVDATVVLEDGKVKEHFQMPRGNVESIYIDHRRGTYSTVTENLSQFLFTLPIRELLDP